jgi:hypothetical protein
MAQLPRKLSISQQLNTRAIDRLFHLTTRRDRVLYLFPDPT